MPPVTTIDFREALRETANQRRDVLFGNGFSIGAHLEFQYPSLLRRAPLSPQLSSIFASVPTTNFEVALRALNARAQGADTVVSARLAGLADELKEHFVNAVAAVHPSTSWMIARSRDQAEERFTRCQQFLQHFIGADRGIPGRVFTTNYDLLLYWTVVRDAALPRKEQRLHCEDGFLYGPFQPVRAGNAQVFYLHGGLHIVELAGEVYKLRYRDEEPLIKQIRERLRRGEFPVFVSEGEGPQKYARIRENKYLNAAFGKFRHACGQAGSAIFIFGHGLSSTDNHLFNLICGGKVARVFIGVFGDETSKAWRHAVDVATEWVAQRSGMAHGSVLTVSIYDSRQCTLWGD